MLPETAWKRIRMKLIEKEMEKLAEKTKHLVAEDKDHDQVCKDYIQSEDEPENTPELQPKVAKKRGRKKKTMKRSFRVVGFLLLLSLNASRAFTLINEPTSSRHSPICMATVQSQAACFPVQLNEFLKRPVPDPIKEALSIYKEGKYYEKLPVDLVTLVTAAPGSPGFPRQLWLVVLASIPTGLLWYGYYKFAVEEELLQVELDAGKEPRGFGGYGTIGLFSYGMLLGPLAACLHIPGGINWTISGIIFIYYTQFLLYDRVNELFSDEGQEKPLQMWWCLPIFFPFNLIVGLRQVHFLAQYFYMKQGVANPPSDPVADFFPFIKAERFTWQEFVLSPSLWCSLLSDMENVDSASLPKPVQDLFKLEGMDN
jgi:hypothetical protein